MVNSLYYSSVDIDGIVMSVPTWRFTMEDEELKQKIGKKGYSRDLALLLILLHTFYLTFSLFSHFLLYPKQV